MLRESRRDAAGKTALVAGAGGMGRAAAAALRALGLRVAMTSRGAERLRRACGSSRHRGVAADEAASRRWDVLVNATPAGSSRDPDGRALDAAWAAPGGIVMEATYRPLETPLRARGAGARSDRDHGRSRLRRAGRRAAPDFLPEIEAPTPLGPATTWALAPNASS